MTTNQTPTPIHDARREKTFADEYNETLTEIPLQAITGTKLTHSCNIDITYRTNANTHRTIRCYHASEPASYNETPEGFYSWYYDGTEYAYSPDDQRLITINRNGSNVTVATSDDIVRVEEVEFGERAPVAGAVTSDVEVTIYYRSPRSDTMQSVTVDVGRLESRRSASEISGVDEDGRKIVAKTRWEREIVAGRGRRKRTLGRVARVEFPRGKRLTVDVENVQREKIEDRLESIEQVIAEKAFRHSDDVEVSVEIDGDLGWDE